MHLGRSNLSEDAYGFAILALVEYPAEVSNPGAWLRVVAYRNEVHAIRARIAERTAWANVAVLEGEGIEDPSTFTVDPVAIAKAKAAKQRYYTDHAATRERINKRMRQRRANGYKQVRSPATKARDAARVKAKRKTSNA